MFTVQKFDEAGCADFIVCFYRPDRIVCETRVRCIRQCGAFDPASNCPTGVEARGGIDDAVGGQGAAGR